jgi:hypothetical protein
VCSLEQNLKICDGHGKLVGERSTRHDAACISMSY